MPTSRDGSVKVTHRFIDGYHVLTSADVYGLYVASKDERAAFERLAPSLEKLIRLNEGVECRIEPAALPACPFCGHDGHLVRVHGHQQCPRCTAVVVRCCDD